SSTVGGARFDTIPTRERPWHSPPTPTRSPTPCEPPCRSQPSRPSTSRVSPATRTPTTPTTDSVGRVAPARPAPTGPDPEQGTSPATPAVTPPCAAVPWDVVGAADLTGGPPRGPAPPHGAAGRTSDGAPACPPSPRTPPPRGPDRGHPGPTSVGPRWHPIRTRGKLARWPKAACRGSWWASTARRRASAP